MATTSRLAIGSPYHNSHLCAMRAFGPAPRSSKGFDLSMKRAARQNLGSPIRVMSSHSGDRSIMLGKPRPLLLLSLRCCSESIATPIPIDTTIPSKEATCSANAVQLAHALLTSSLCRLMTSQPCAVLRIRCHEDDPLALHARLRIQTCRSQSVAIPDIWQNEATESIHGDSGAEARSQ